MENQLEAFELDLPSGINKETVKKLKKELSEIEGIEECGSGTTRSLDPESITLWVTLISTVITTIGTAMPVMQKVIGLFKKNNIKGVKLALSDGRIVELDNISSDDLIKLTKETAK